MARLDKVDNTAEINAMLGTLQIDDTSTVSVTIDDVWFSKKADKEVWNNGLLTYTIEVRNEGDPDIPDPNLTDITITDMIDIVNTRLLVDKITFTPVGAGTATYNSTTGSLEITLNDIPPGQTVEISFPVERILP